jgi:hypothetical protein
MGALEESVFNQKLMDQQDQGDVLMVLAGQAWSAFPIDSPMEELLFKVLKAAKVVVAERDAARAELAKAQRVAPKL